MNANQPRHPSDVARNHLLAARKAPESDDCAQRLPPIRLPAWLIPKAGAAKSGNTGRQTAAVPVILMPANHHGPRGPIPIDNE